ncbi:MAG: aminopeptidase [Herbiconiux sp.]|nr:aminopeptidase [Herbiconiux sp.]
MTFSGRRSNNCTNKPVQCSRSLERLERSESQWRKKVQSSAPEDPRWQKLASHIARTLEIVQDSRVSIFVNDAGALDASEALTSAARKLGARTQTLFRSEREDASELLYSSAESIAEAPAIERAAMDWSTVHVSFRAMVWPETPLDPPSDLSTRLAAQRQAKGAISTLRWQNTKWAIVRVPTAEWAEKVDVSFDALLDEFFAGSLDDWDARKVQWASLDRAVDDAREILIVSPDTNLRLGVAGRRSAMFAGEANLPDGEIATAPLDSEVSGHITFPGLTVFAGQRIENLRLAFANGEVVEIHADTGGDIAKALIATDAGSRRVGELGIGTNAHITSWTGDLFIDEKILGSVHIALGRAYPQCGGINESTLHWDIVKDLRGDNRGSLLVDDVPIVERGVVVWPGLT